MLWEIAVGGGGLFVCFQLIFGGFTALCEVRTGPLRVMERPECKFTILGVASVGGAEGSLGEGCNSASWCAVLCTLCPGWFLLSISSRPVSGHRSSLPSLNEHFFLKGSLGTFFPFWPNLNEHFLWGHFSGMHATDWNQESGYWFLAPCM